MQIKETKRNQDVMNCQKLPIELPMYKMTDTAQNLTTCILIF